MEGRHDNLDRIRQLEERLAQTIRDSDRKIKQLKALTELSAILNSTLDHVEVKKRAMEAATRFMNCEVDSLLILDGKKNELYFDVALGEKGERVKEIKLSVGEGIAGWVIKHDKPLLIPDVSKDPRHFKKADEKSKFVTRDMLCVPLKLKDKIIGALEVINKLGGDVFNSLDLELFQLLANQVAIAIDNSRLYKELQETFLQTSEALADAIEKRDPYTGGHTKRVLRYSMVIAKYLNMDSYEKDRLKISAILHDIGKIGIEDVILRKPSRLNKSEFDEMKKHPVFGHEIVEKIVQLRDIIPGMMYHHERLDGTGYPEGLDGSNIPLIAKVIAVADTFDAMTTDRPYRKALDSHTAIEELKKGSGKQFSADVITAFIKAYNNGDVLND